MPGQRSLDSFVEDHGRTDDIRSDIDLDPPEDGHVRRANRIDDYWRGLTERFGSPHPAYSIVPQGSVRIILEPDEDVVTPGYGVDEPLERGVYLDGRAEVGTLPPEPVEVDDEYLKFAAEAALLAVDRAADDGEIVAISMNNLSLSFAVRGMDRREQEYVVQRTSDPVTYPEECPDELYYGFATVRRFGTPYEVYTKAEVPRLDLEDLDVENLSTIEPEVVA